MKIVSRGRIAGLEYDSDNGLRLQCEVFPDTCYGETTTFLVPFNYGRPKPFDLETIRDKKVKITVELIDEK